MKSSRIAILVVCLAFTPTYAAVVSSFTINGYLGPGDAAIYPVDAPYSWISHLYPGNSIPHSWTQAAGTDGGIIFARVQSGKGEITAVRPMYNLNSWLFSVGTGLSISASDNTVNFRNLQMNWGGTILDLGNAPGTSPDIPLVADITALSGTENGWQWLSDGSYQLLYHSNGLCDGCQLTIHLTGNVVTVPVPAALFLFAPGFWGLVRMGKLKPKIGGALFESGYRGKEKQSSCPVI